MKEMHFLLYGDTDTEPKKGESDKLIKALLESDKNVLFRIVANMDRMQFEVMLPFFKQNTHTNGVLS